MKASESSNSWCPPARCTILLVFNALFLVLRTEKSTLWRVIAGMVKNDRAVSPDINTCTVGI